MSPNERLRRRCLTALGLEPLAYDAGGHGRRRAEPAMALVVEAPAAA